MTPDQMRCEGWPSVETWWNRHRVNVPVAISVYSGVLASRILIAIIAARGINSCDLLPYLVGDLVLVISIPRAVGVE